MEGGMDAGGRGEGRGGQEEEERREGRGRGEIPLILRYCATRPAMCMQQ